MSLWASFLHNLGISPRSQRSPNTMTSYNPALSTPALADHAEAELNHFFAFD
jgi:hypothetical protein